MGLDMYLTGRMYVNEWLNTQGYEAVKGVFPQIPWRITGVSFEAGYWRKANQIHKWFVDNVQDGVDECEEHIVSLEQMEQLLSVCKRVIADPKLGEELLPASSGFFFGPSFIWAVSRTQFLFLRKSFLQRMRRNIVSLIFITAVLGKESA